MTSMVTSGSMSGEKKRSDGLLGESGNERRRSFLAPPDLDGTALLLDSTRQLLVTRPRVLPSASERVASSARPSPRRDVFAPHDSR
jgi:hypothetical protein